MDRIPSYIRKYAEEDIKEALDIANGKSRTHVSLVELKYEGSPSEDEDYSIVVTADLSTKDGRSFEVMFEYAVEGDNVYLGGSVQSIATRIVREANTGAVSASTHVRKKRIYAADGEFDSLPEGEEITDAIDDMADDVDEMQEELTLDQFDEPTIEVNNNIADHYIAECDACGGVFISAMIESDIETEKISGICPICEKESDQHLNWVIKEV